MRFDPSDGISGELVPPPDKSISHRAALLAAMSDNAVHVKNYLEAEDTRSTLEAVEALGAEVSGQGDLVIDGVGLRGAGEASIDVGNAGTLMRLLPGWLAGQPLGEWELDGDDSIRRRPMDRIALPLREMGASIECRDERFAPIVVHGGSLEGIEYELPVASAQVKSAVLLAGLLADGETTVIEPIPTRDHTERMLEMCGVPVDREPGRVSVETADGLIADEFVVPADFSSAAFMIVAATLVEGSELTLEQVGINPTRVGLASVMRRMGAYVDGALGGGDEGEPASDIEIRSSGLVATEVEPGEVPLLIDELPLVALLGVFAEGTTIVRGAEELRHKESDRIATVVDGLTGLGASIEATADGFVVEGTGELRGGAISSHGDHRLAMLGAVAGLASRNGVEVHGFEAAAVSYPGFAADLEALTVS